MAMVWCKLGHGRCWRTSVPVYRRFLQALCPFPCSVHAVRSSLRSLFPCWFVCPLHTNRPSTAAYSYVCGHKLLFLICSNV